MEDDYLFNVFNLPVNTGLNDISENRTSQYILTLDIEFDFHAIGNRGVNEALNTTVTVMEDIG